MNRRTFLTVTAAGIGSVLGAGIAAEEAAKARRITTVVPQLRAIPLERRWMLARNPDNKSVYALNALAPEMDEVEVDNRFHDAAAGKTFRVVAWNMERGRHWKEGVKLIQEHPSLKKADVLLLTEMDLGIPRSGNANTTRETAAALGMNYAYGVEFIELPRDGDAGRKDMENATFGFHGNAILSRWPLNNVRMIRMPGIESWYGADEHRLGGRMALFAEIEAAGQPVVLVSTHLESIFKANDHRLAQIQGIVEEVTAHSPGMPVILGGDFNTIPSSAAVDALRTAGFLVDEVNVLAERTNQFVKNGRFMLGFAHIDYLAVRGMTVVKEDDSPAVVPAYIENNGKPELLSDHAMVTAAVSLPWKSLMYPQFDVIAFARGCTKSLYEKSVCISS